MLGFVIGTACLIGLIHVLRRGSCGYGHYGWGGAGACGGGWGGRFGGGYRDHGGPDFGGHDGPPWARGWGERGGFGGSRAGFFLRGLLEHLDATPAQEKVISEAFRELRDEGVKWRDEARKSRADIGKAMRAEGFDEVVLGELFARHDAALEAMRRALTGVLAKVHNVLDEAQRARLADWIEHGPGFFGRSRRRRYG